MPRRRRFGPPELPIHVRQRWNNRQAILVDDNGGRVYLDWLAEVRAHLAGMETDWGAVAGKPGTPDIGELVPTHASKRGSLGTDSFVELLRRRLGAPSSDPGFLDDKNFARLSQILTRANLAGSNPCLVGLRRSLARDESRGMKCGKLVRSEKTPASTSAAWMAGIPTVRKSGLRGGLPSAVD